MLKEFPIKFGKGRGKPTAAGGIDSLEQDFGKKLDMKQEELFHRTVAKLSFVGKRGRPDTQTTVSALCGRVRAPGGKDWKVLVCLMKFPSDVVEDAPQLSVGKGFACWNGVSMQHSECIQISEGMQDV